MILKKIRFTDYYSDSLKTELGKALTVKNNKIVETDEQSSLNIQYGARYYDNGDNNLIEMKSTFLIRNPGKFSLKSNETPYSLAEIIAPVHINQIAVNDDTKAVSSAYVKTKFNFVSEQYESFISEINERSLPCIYLESDPQQTKTIMHLKTFPRVIPKARHFYDFNYLLKPRYTASERDRFQNLLFGQNFNFAVGNTYKEQYPFYNNIKFNYNTSNDFKNMLKSFNFFEHFIDDYMEATKTQQTFTIQTSEAKGSEVGTRPLSSFDVATWLQKSDFAFGSNKVVFEPTEKRKNRYNYFLDKLSFVGKMRKFSQNKLRTIQEIHNNKLVDSEILFFRIDKFVETGSTPVQSFWIPADDKFVDFVDTQIRYGIKYTYRINAYVLVFGCKYSYQTLHALNNNLHAQATIKPNFKIIEIKDVFSDHCRVVQPPQPVPNIQFVNESNKEDYIKIYLNLTVNSEETDLKIIKTTDLLQEDLRVDYDRLEERPRFVYNNERALYEIYRTDFIPESYTDLEGYKIAEIRNEFPSTGAMYKDVIQPWKKYYYVFRSVNYHGLVSNPTPIYEVEITKDADESFLNTKTVPLFVPKESQPTRTFMKLLQAVPASQHTIFDPGQLDEETQSLAGKVIDNLTLGVAKHSIWGKKFKFRITSKQTGRKIDINIKTNLTKKKTLENSK